MGSHGFIPSPTHRVLFFFLSLVFFLMLILPLSLSPSFFLLVAVQHQCIKPLLYPFLIDSVLNWSQCCARHPQVVEKFSRRRTDHVLKLAGSRTVEKRRTGGRNGTRRTPPGPDTWYAEVFRRVMPAGYDPTWSPPAVKKPDSARKEEECKKNKSWEKNPTLTQAARCSKGCLVERTWKSPGRGL